MRADGKIIERLPIVFYEKSGPPKKFYTEVEEFKNLHCLKPSKSGKMSTETVLEWIEQAFLPNAGDDRCLIIDSWTGYNALSENEMVLNHNLGLVTIPPGATAELQPADIFFNRTVKFFCSLIFIIA